MSFGSAGLFIAAPKRISVRDIKTGNETLPNFSFHGCLPLFHSGLGPKRARLQSRRCSPHLKTRKDARIRFKASHATDTDSLPDRCVSWRLFRFIRPHRAETRRVPQNDYQAVTSHYGRPNRWRYSMETRNALTISAFWKLPLKLSSLFSQKL